jgi:hypothetical protein
MVLTWGSCCPGSTIRAIDFSEDCHGASQWLLLIRLYIFSSAELRTLRRGQEERAVGCQHCDLRGDHAVGVVALDAVR